MLQRPVQAEGLVAAKSEPLAQASGQQLVERGRELGQVPAQSVVPQQGIDHRLQLCALFRGHRAQERLHGRHSLGQLLDDVVEILGAREESTVFLEELARVGLAPGEALLEQPVQVPNHLPVCRQVFRGDALDGLGQAADVLVEDLPLELRNQLIEPITCLWLEEVVLLQSPYASSDLRRQGVELIEPPGGHVPQHRPKLGVRGRRLLG